MFTEFLTSIDWGSVMTYAVAVFFTLDMAYIAYTKREWMDAYRNISWRLMLADMLVIGLIVIAYYSLVQLYQPIFNFSWWTLLGGSSSESKNIVFMASEIRYLGIVFCLVALLALPYMAKIEENLFRLGTRSWGDGIVRSVIFGFFHMIVGIPVGAAIGIAGAGLFFTYCYFKGGVKLSTQAHFQYNLILVMFMLYLAIGLSIS